MKDEEKRLNHKLSPLYEGLVQLRDDPACSSAGCPKQEYVAKEEAKIVQYPSNLPLDPALRSLRTSRVKDTLLSIMESLPTSYNGKNAQ